MKTKEAVLTETEIAGIVGRIVDEIHPRRVILFGSYAAGTATANSDLDLLIIVNSDDPSYKRSARVRSLLFPPPVSMDILVLTDEEFSRGEALGGHIVHTAIQNGKVLYAA